MLHGWHKHIIFIYTESNRPQIIKIRATPTFLVCLSPRVKCTQHLICGRSLTFMLLVFALPSVPRVIITWIICVHVEYVNNLHYKYSQSTLHYTPKKGGGALSIYTGGGVARHIQKGGGGVLGTGTTQKRGVLGTGTTPKRGVLGTGTSRKRGGGPKNWSCKKDNLSNWCFTKGGFVSLFIKYPYFFFSTWSIGGGLLWQTQKRGHGSGPKNGGLRHGSGSKKGGLRHELGKKKGGSILRHIPVLDIYAITLFRVDGLNSNLHLLCWGGGADTELWWVGPRQNNCISRIERALKSTPRTPRPCNYCMERNVVKSVRTTREGDF